MKYKYLIYLLFSLLLHACDDMVDQDIPGGNSNGNVIETGTSEMYVLNEGLFNLNNSTLMRYSFKDSRMDMNYFRSLNRRGLGLRRKALHCSQCFESDRGDRLTIGTFTKADSNANRKRKFTATTIYYVPQG